MTKAAEPTPPDQAGTQAEPANQDPTALIVARAMRRFDRWQLENNQRTDRIFGRLLVGQWLFSVVLAFLVAPFTFSGTESSIHPHVVTALALGLGVIALPLFLIFTQSGSPLTRHVIAVAQMLISAILIHVTGGRIETHFHVFGSLAFLAFYVDWRVLLTGALTTTLDHALRGYFYPRSIYGISQAEWWRFLEHGAWVVFCIAFLAHHASWISKSWLRFAEEGGMLEAMAESEWRQRSVLEREAEERASNEATG